MAAKTTSVFGDRRLDRRAQTMLEQIVATGSLIGRTFGGTREGEIAAQGLRIVAAQDTTEINFAGRDKRHKGLGLTEAQIPKASSFTP